MTDVVPFVSESRYRVEEISVDGLTTTREDGSVYPRSFFSLVDDLEEYEMQVVFGREGAGSRMFFSEHPKLTWGERMDLEQYFKWDPKEEWEIL